MNRWYAGRVVRVQGTVVKVRVGTRPKWFGVGQDTRPMSAFVYLDFALKRRVPRIGELVCERLIIGPGSLGLGLIPTGAAVAQGSCAK